MLHLDIGRNEWALTMTTDQCLTIGTKSVRYDLVFICAKVGKWALMARVGEDTNMDSIDSIFQKIRDINQGTLDEVKMKLIGGDPLYGTANAKLVREKLPDCGHLVHEEATGKAIFYLHRVAWNLQVRVADGHVTLENTYDKIKEPVSRELVEKPFISLSRKEWKHLKLPEDWSELYGVAVSGETLQMLKNKDKSEIDDFVWV